jgi:hypothetical protein
VNRRLRRDGNPLLDMVRAVDPDVDEMQFNDALTANLRRGRFLLLIIGDGIREGVEAIAEYLHTHVGLHFSLGLVELPIYRMANGDRLVVPRVLARTALVTRNVVAVPDGYVVDESGDLAGVEEIDPVQKDRADEHQQFWTEFLQALKLDDPEQSKPKPTRKPNIWFDLPARGAWLTVYHLQSGELGLFLSSRQNTSGAYAMQAIVDDWDALKDKLAGNARLYKGYERGGRYSIIDSLQVGSLEQPEVRKKAFSWLAERVNTFVNVLRPRMRSAAADYQSRSE